MNRNSVIILGGVAALLAFIIRLQDGRTVAATVNETVGDAVSTVTGAVGGALAGYGGDGALSREQVAALADEITSQYYPQVDPAMLVAIAEIESSFRPTAFRVEVSVADMSTGLMQTLTKTAKWLYRDMGARAFGEPSATALFDPRVSMYFGAAYINWLQRYKGEDKPEEWVVRGYNGGPGNAAPGDPDTDNYWRKYLRARFGVGG